MSEGKNPSSDEQWMNLLVSLRSGSPAATAGDVLHVINAALTQARREGAEEERERLRGPCGWLIADPDIMDESSWTIELDPTKQDGIVSMPLHIHPDHADTFDALMESAGTKRPYHEVLSAALRSQGEG